MIELRELHNRSSLFHIVLAVLTGVCLVALAFGTGFAVAWFQPGRSLLEATVQDPGATSTLDLFKEAWDVVTEVFYGPLPAARARSYGAVRGLLSTLDDPYSVLIEPIPRQFEQDDLSGFYGGVGVELSRDEEGRVVLSPLRASPATAAGVLEGDVLLAVDGVPITPEMDLAEDIVASIRGEVGTEVALTVQRGAERLTFTITRQVIETLSVEWRSLEQPALGYVRISSFTDRTVDELGEGLEELLDGGAEGLILDLRGNGGGLLQAALDVADQFFDGDVLLYESGRRRAEEKVYEASATGRAMEIPLVVLVDRGTASASEIVAGAIQDRERGLLVGETTFGKGSVQLIFDLSDGSSLHVTSARWFTPNHHQLDGVGLTPDVVVEADPEGDGDVQLERAVDVLQAELGIGD